MNPDFAILSKAEAKVWLEGSRFHHARKGPEKATGTPLFSGSSNFYH
jgi:hypothetical protein